MRTLKKKTKTRVVIFATTVCVLMGVCLVLVVEDAAQVPTTLNGKIEIDPTLFKDIFLNEWTYNTLRDFLLQHPDWAESIAKYLIENFDLAQLLEHLTLEELQQLCEMFPGMEAVLGPILLGALGALGDGNPTVEPKVSIPEIMAAAYGTIDNGTLGEDDPEIQLFTVDSTYRGATYIRSSSLGDYDPGTRHFLNAPEFDGKGYVAAPSLFPSYATSGEEPYTLTFHLNGHRDYGTLVGDVSASTYIDDTGLHKFDPDGENRVWLIDSNDYRVSFYPQFNYDSAYIDDTYVVRNERKYRSFVKENYLGVAEVQKAMLQRFIDETGVTTPEQAAAYMQNNFEYAYKAMDCPMGDDLVEYFLFTKKAGTCTNFASALMLLSRQMGVPARFVQGYYDSLAAEEGNSISTKNAHAWTEIYVDGVGWKRLDATPGDKTQEIPYTVDPKGETGNPDPMSEEETDALITISSPSYFAGPVYLRSTAFGDYNLSKGAFDLVDESELPIASSAAYYKNFVTGSPTYLNITYGKDFSPYGMLTANYSDLTYDEGTIASSYRYEGGSEFTPVGDARFARQETEYAQRMYSDVNFSGPSIDDGDYLPFLSKTYPLTVPSLFQGAVSTYLSQTGVTTPEGIVEAFQSKHVHDIKATDATVVDFLTGDHVGTNQVYATAMVMLCRSLGYYARYVEGYRYVGDLNANAQIDLDASKLHYWVEVYYQGHGWKRFDPTPDSVSGDPTISAKLKLETINVTYDGKNHLPTLEDIKVTFPPTYTSQGIDPKQTYGFDTWKDLCLRTGDVAELRFHPTYGEGYSAPGSYHLAAVKLVITDAWGNDVTSLYTGLDQSELGTDCYLVITDPTVVPETGGSL